MAQKIIIVDDHPLVRGAIVQALQKSGPGITLTETGNLDECLAVLADDDDVDLVLLDLHMPGTSGFAGLFMIHALYPDLPVAIISATDDAAVIQRCIDFGALGFIPKTAQIDVISDAVSQIIDGTVWLPEDYQGSTSPNEEDAQLAARIDRLTPQQMRVMMMLTEGLLNKQIAYELDISLATVKAHVSAILRKLEVHSRTQAVIVAKKLLTDDPSRKPLDMPEAG